ncbi:MAG TPA: hypothetical protein VGP70_18630 [Actinomadura sp.]|jgi:hypothetical protein|nr:hypothetical protein [Actinomadura sp.]
MTEQYGVHLIGGEMFDWSDADASRPGGGALETLLLRVVPASGHVLLAGPHRDGLVDRLIAHCARVTCLVRSLPDAQELGRRQAGSGRLTVLCGGLDKLGDEGPYDAIVAAGGFHSLAAPDSSALTWSESLDRLSALLAPAGALVIGVENELGVHRLVDPGGAAPDGEWLPRHGVDGTVPVGPAELVARLRERGASVERCYAAYPGLVPPAVLITADRLEERLGPDGAAATLISAALAHEFTGRHVLADPCRLARSALSHGLGARLAPAWIAVVRPAGELPAGLITDGSPGHWAATYELRDDDGRWVRGDVQPPGPRDAGRVLREPARLAGPVPAGYTLEESLRTACALSDVPAVRRLLRSYARWLAGQAPGIMAFATPGNVIVDGEWFAVLDPSWELAGELPFELALARALRQFAAGLVSGGYRHPWPTTLDLDGVTVTLLAMAGHPGDRALLGQAVELEAELEAAVRGLSAADHARLLAELQSGMVREPLGYREALVAQHRLTEELADARARAAWLDTALKAKETELVRAAETAQGKLDDLNQKRRQDQAELKRLQQELKARTAQITALRNSLSHRVGRLVTAPLRAFRALVRRAR